MEYRPTNHMTMHQVLHPREASIQLHKYYINKRGERNYADNILINRSEITRKQKLKEKNCGNFKQTNKTSEKKTWTKIRKGNLKKETSSLLILPQNNAMRTSYIKTRKDKTQQNSKYRLCADRDEIINRIKRMQQISEGMRRDTTG